MFKTENNKCYQMPAHFGGYVYQPVETCYHDVVNMGFTYATDGALLSDYIPEGFELLRPEISIGFSQCREVDWMAGAAYNLIDVSVPVRFNGRRDKVEGSFSLVVWENKTAPILTGREQTGVAKIYADIEDLHILGSKRFTAASYEGNTFLRLEITAGEPVKDDASPMESVSVNAMHWRYIPKVGGPGADLSQMILFPQRVEARKILRGSGKVQWTALCYEQCPTQAHIIQALAGLPIMELLAAEIMYGEIFLIASQARVLE